MGKKEANKVAKKSTEQTSAAGAKKAVTVLVAILVIVLVGVMSFLVYRNNQASKATHVEFETAQKDFSTAEAAYKEAEQGLASAQRTCEKTYTNYELCPALAKVHTEVNKEYAAVKEEVDSITTETVDEMEKASATLQTSTETVSELKGKANDAVATYEKDLLKAVTDEHNALATQVRTNLKEAKALLSTSKDKTSDEELWNAYSRILDVHEQELNKQDEVKGDNPDSYIASSEILKVENAAIISATNHLKEIYENQPAYTAVTP
ncbi:MAG: hypothetical protein IKZ87_04940 [Actinomycetaceae bacterium]|nr:hypothetical protein [Actinomycetaceae bacterium]